MSLLARFAAAFPIVPLIPILLSTSAAAPVGLLSFARFSSILSSLSLCAATPPPAFLVLPFITARPCASFLHLLLIPTTRSSFLVLASIPILLRSTSVRVLFHIAIAIAIFCTSALLHCNLRIRSLCLPILLAAAGREYQIFSHAEQSVILPFECNVLCVGDAEKSESC